MAQDNFLQEQLRDDSHHCFQKLAQLEDNIQRIDHWCSKFAQHFSVWVCIAPLVAKKHHGSWPSKWHWFSYQRKRQVSAEYCPLNAQSKYELDRPSHVDTQTSWTNPQSPLAGPAASTGSISRGSGPASDKWAERPAIQMSFHWHSISSDILSQAMPPRTQSRCRCSRGHFETTLSNAFHLAADNLSTWARWRSLAYQLQQVWSLLWAIWS